MEKVDDVKSEIKLIDVLNFKQGLNSVNSLKGVKFAYAVSKNSKKVDVEIEAFKEVQKPHKEFEAYEKERLEMCVEKSEKDENGNPIIVDLGNGQQKYKIADEVWFENFIKSLQEQYKESIQNREQQMKDVENLLQSNIEIDFHKVGVNDLPQDITAAQLNAIDLMIAD
jgi:hypothetical protein